MPSSKNVRCAALVVTCEEDLQLQRLMEQRHLSERESKLMIAAQMPLDQKGRRERKKI
jgi:dephospho-CoA kinase